ncbi:Adenylate cyclase type 10 [Blyttiomyces sp. JEL0837]|nr:Adenylate cyclase type 10 [Blyttiomyces sp. JEL0837]
MEDLFQALVPKTVRRVCENNKVSKNDIQRGSQIKVVPLPACVESNGAVAIIDLSGYTNLTEVLFETRGSNGGERVNNTVNPLFAGIINTCHKYDGDIIKFCGDALIVSWPVFNSTANANSPSRSDTLVLARALICSLEILQAFGSYDVHIELQSEDSSSSLPDKSTMSFEPAFNSDGKGAAAPKSKFFGRETASTVTPKQAARKTPAALLPKHGNLGPPKPKSSIMTLGVHIGIGFGSIIHHFIGSEDARCEYFILGEAVESAGEMLQKTHRGEICMFADRWTVIQSSIPLLADVQLNRMELTVEKRALLTTSSIAGTKLESLANWILNMDESASIPCALRVIPENFIMESAVRRLKDLASTSNDNARMQMQMNELRKVIVVFVKLSSPFLRGASFDQSNFAQEIFRIVNNLLVKYSGHMRQVVYDDKGFTLLLVWGLPPSSAMDEHRALSCSLKLQEIFTDFPSLDFAIGVSAGKSYIGFIGNNLRQDYNLFGRCVNLAARCMSSPLAKRSILCDSGSINTGLSFRFGEEVSLKLKGVKENRTVRILYEEIRTKTVDPNQQVDDNTEKVEIVGRESEIMAMYKALDEWFIAGRGKIIVIQGHAGVGKTALSNLIERRFKSEIEDGSIFILKACGSEMTQQHAFHILRTQLFPSLFKTLRNYIETIRDLHVPKFEFYAIASPDAEVMKSSSIIGSRRTSTVESEQSDSIHDDENETDSMSVYVKEVSRAMNIAESMWPLYNIMVEGCVFPDTEELANISSAGRRAMLRKLLIYVITVAKSRLNKKIIIQVDNYQWVDSKSQTTINQLRSIFPRVLFVIVSRTESEYSLGDSSQLTSFIKDMRTVLISLEGLSASAAEEMAEKILGGKLHKSLATQIIEKSGGIPFVIETLLINLKNAKALVEVDGFMKLDKNKSHHLVFDDSPASIITPQYDALSSNFREIIGIASVLRTSFTVEDILFVRENMEGNTRVEDKNELVERIQEEDKFKFLWCSGIYQLLLKKTRETIHLTALQRKIEMLEKSLLASSSKPHILGTREISVSEIDLLLDVNYHLDRVNAIEIQNKHFCRYKGLLLEYFYDRQMVTDAVRVYEQLMDFFNAHPDVKLEDKVLAKYEVLIGDFYFMLGEEAKAVRCLQDMMVHTIGWKLPEKTWGKIGYILRKLFGGKLTKVTRDINNLDINTVTMAENFYCKLEDPVDMLAECIATVCATHFGASIFYKPINIHTVNLLSTFGQLAFITDKNLMRVVDQARMDCGEKMRGSFALTPSFSQMTFQFWLSLTYRSVGDFQKAEEYYLLTIATGEDLQISMSRLPNTCLTFLREQYYVQGRFDELRPLIDSTISGLRPTNYALEYAFAQELAYQSETLDMQKSQEIYTRMTKIISQSPPLVLLLRRDMAIYELVFRVSEVFVASTVDGTTSPISSQQYLIPTLKRLLQLSQQIPFGPTLRAMITFRVITIWIFLGLLNETIHQQDNKNQQAAKNPWDLTTRPTKILLALLKSMNQWVTVPTSYLTDAAIPLLDATTFILKRQFNAALSKWELAIEKWASHETICGYFYKLIKARFCILKMLTLISTLDICTKKPSGGGNSERRNIFRGFGRRVTGHKRVVPTIGRETDLFEELGLLKRELEGYCDEIESHGDMSNLEEGFMKCYIDAVDSILKR